MDYKKVLAAVILIAFLFLLSIVRADFTDDHSIFPGDQSERSYSQWEKVGEVFK